MPAFRFSAKSFEDLKSTGIEIIRILHDRMDVETRLSGGYPI
jgi:plasmid stabilization system protein ParE